MDTLVTTEWLSEQSDDKDLVVLHRGVGMEEDGQGGVRPASGRPEYDAGHIPGAGFADLIVDLSAQDSPLPWVPMPTPDQFCAAMGALGVGDDFRVVLYDGYYSMLAARVWWMLRWVGFDRAAILDGGFKLWTAEGRPISADPVERLSRTLTPHVRPNAIAGRDEVLAGLDSDAVCLIDALPLESFRAQHIPGASNLDAISLVDESGRYQSHTELAAMHDGDRNARTITYCGGGVAASSNAFVMTRLGFTDVAVYAASLQEWMANPDNPLVEGTA